MSKIKFNNSEEFYDIVEFKKISDHVVELIGDIPADTNGFDIFMDKNIESPIGRYPEYKTIYKRLPDGLQFSDNKSVWEPTVKFVAEVGGKLNGNVEQKVADYSKLTIPTVTADEDYTFTGWEPTIPTSGSIKEDVTFTAKFESVPMVIFDSNGGKLEGELVQKVSKYKDVVVPQTINDTAHTFIEWSPIIPTSGSVVGRNVYTAIFDIVSVEDRLATLETSQEIQDGAIVDLADVINEGLATIRGEQEIQDGAIEELATIINE